MVVIITFIRAYVMRLNCLDTVFAPLIEEIQGHFSNNYLKNIRLIDSMPIILAKEKRSSLAKVFSIGFKKKLTFKPLLKFVLL